MAIGLEDLKKKTNSKCSNQKKISTKEKVVKPWESFDQFSQVRTIAATEAVKNAREITSKNNQIHQKLMEDQSTNTHSAQSPIADKPLSEHKSNYPDSNFKKQNGIISLLKYIYSQIFN